MPKKRQSRKPAKKPKMEYRYGTLLPHEFDVLLPLMKEFYQEINLEEAVENPMPFLYQMKKGCFESPYNIVYACFGPGLEPFGYIWFTLDRDKLGNNFIKIEHIVVAKKKKNTRIGYRLIKYSVELGFRHGAERCELEARTKETEAMWRKLGFKSKYIAMEFEGGAVEFGEANPAFKLNELDFQEKEYGKLVKTALLHLIQKKA